MSSNYILARSKDEEILKKDAARYDEYTKKFPQKLLGVAAS